MPPPDSIFQDVIVFSIPIKAFRGDRMKYLNNEKGQGLTEYALIIALVAIVAVAALTLLGGQIDSIFGTITTDLGGAAG